MSRWHNFKYDYPKIHVCVRRLIHHMTACTRKIHDLGQRIRNVQMFGQTLESLLQILKTSLANGSFPNSLLLETVGAASEGVTNSVSPKTLIWGWPLQAPPWTWVTGQTHQTHLGGALNTRMRRATVFPSLDKRPVLRPWSSGCLNSRESCLQEREVRDKGVRGHVGCWGWQ